MHALVIVSHPVRDSLTQSVARRIASGISAGGAHTAELADLFAEGFDPRFGAADHDFFNGKGLLPADARAEQARLDRADALVLVYPVYWWSMPGQLKGWIDRVFTNGWAYEDQDGEIVRKLGRLNVHLVAIGGGDLRTYARRGYFGAMRLQIDEGIFGYCGAPVRSTDLLVPGEVETPYAHLDRADAIARRLISQAD